MPDTLTLNAQFQQWLLATPQALDKFIEMIKLWYANQGKLPPETPGSGPKEFSPGEEQPITTIAISDADLDAIYHGYATAIVKEKLIEFIKGFISGVMFAGGGA